MKLVADFLNEMKRNDSSGRCLHFERGVRCNEIINAHSIQRSNQLGKIVESGHVYRISAEISDQHESNGLLTPKKIGWKKVSTFAGFCKLHDNDLFKPIDNFHLKPNAEQVALYAYRCLCREYFVKENAINTLTNVLGNNSDLAEEINNFFESSLFGHSLGFQRLQHHKKYFDLAFFSKNYNEFEFITITSSSPWNLQLSGVLYPDFDFLGKNLQNLGDLSSPLDLITFFTAPFEERGWTFTLCWHASSNNSCSEFAKSLGVAVHNGIKPQDALLRFAFSCCENHAFRISWWEALPCLAKEAILNRMELMAALDIPVPPDYLAKGLDGIADWEFENIFTTLEVNT